MSEYQDYRWSCVNRSLSRADAKKIDQLSSHINVTAASAQVDYSYGDFKHDPIKVLGSYFDIFTYEANWGSQTVAFRFDAGSVDHETMSLFSQGDTLKVTEKGNSVIIEAGCWEENFLDSRWIPDDYEEERFHRIYQDILDGDFRALFLLWLKSSSHCGTDSRNHSVPIPAGLAELHSDYTELAEFIGLDPDLISAAIRFPPGIKPTPQLQPDFDGLLKELPAERMRKALSDLLSDDAGSVARSLRNELTSLSPKKAKRQPKLQLVPFTEIEKMAAELKENRDKKAKEDEQRSKDAYLKSLAQHETRIWRLLESLINERKPKTYDQAVGFLHGLRDLYEHRDMTDLFVEKVTELTEAFPSLGGMRRRLEVAGHLSTEPPVKRKPDFFIDRNRLSPSAKRQQFIDDLLVEIAERSL